MRRGLTWGCLAVLAFASASFAEMPFNGKDLTGWEIKGPKEGSHWKVGIAKVDPNNPGEIELSETPEGKRGDLVNVKAAGLDLYTQEKFGDATIEVEVLVPRGSNSGIYVMGEYEVQVFDSYGKETLGQGDMGALYGAAPPKVNATKEPGEWNKFVIEYQAPRFDNQGKKTANAKIVKVTLNGKALHENVEMKGPTPGGVSGKEAAAGPLMFQGNHGPVAYRNLRITPAGK